MRLWACRCCAEKDARIAAMQSEVEFLRSLVRRPEHHNSALPVVTLEADAVLSGKEDQTFVEITQDDRQAREEEYERDRILAGTY